MAAEGLQPFVADLIRQEGACVGLAINPATPVGALAEMGQMLDLALCMTVNPGWGGQPFIEHSLEKLVRTRAILGSGQALEVDGGIDPHTGPRCREAGASLFVAGSAIFDSPDPGEAYQAIARSVGAE